MLRAFDNHDEVDLGIEIDLDLEVGIGVRDLACHMDSLCTPSRTNAKCEMDTCKGKRCVR